MEEKTKPGSVRHILLWAELQQKAKDDPELAKKLDAAKSVIERYRETLQRLGLPTNEKL